MVELSQLEDTLFIDEPVDFIFDHQEGMVAPIQDAWNALQTIAPPQVKKRLGRRPQFGDDKNDLPLQAADLRAWWIRRQYFDLVNGNPAIPFMWKDTGLIRSVHIIVENHELIDFFATIATAVKSHWTFSWGARKFIQYAHWRFALERW